jgi:CMP-N-acetylneuraminic acid synthetase
MSEKVAIIILARGKYSKRIPQKPLAILKNKTLMEHTLDFAIKLEYPIYVYTDLQEIKNICSFYENINIREKKYESENGIHQTAKEIIDYNQEICADIIILLQVTSPFRNAEKAKNWITAFCESDYNCGFAGYYETGYFYKSGCDGQVRAINYDPKERTYNQGNYTRLIKETGSFYIFRKEQLQKNHIMNGKIACFEDDYNIDINTYEDLRKAEYEN